MRFVDLRSIDQWWYNGLEGEEFNPHIPNENNTTYVIRFDMGEWIAPRVKTKIAVSCSLLEHTESWNHAKVNSWGTYTELHRDHVLVDENFLLEHPKILKSLNARKAPVSIPVKIAKKQKTVIRSVKPTVPTRAPPPIPRAVTRGSKRLLRVVPENPQRSSPRLRKEAQEGWKW